MAEEVNVTETDLTNAIAETERDIFAKALGNEPATDEGGDRSLEDIDDDLEGGDADNGESEVKAAAETPKEDAKPDQSRDEKTGQFVKAEERPQGVPPGRLKEESDKRRAAESERDTIKTERDTFKSELDSIRREFDALKVGLQRPEPKQPDQPQPQVPDMFADPEGYQRFVLAQANQAATQRFIGASLDDAKEAHGEKFNSAYAELVQIGEAEKRQFGTSPTVARVWNAANPGRELMRWHQERATVREIGNDPNAWLERKLEERLNDPEFQAKAIERARQGAPKSFDTGKRNTRLPPSLNEQSGTSHMNGEEIRDGSDAAIFERALSMK